MWNKDSSRRSSLTVPRNFSPVNAFPPSPRQFPTPPVSGSTYAPPHRPFFRNTFSPVPGVPPIRDNSPSRVPQSSDAGLQNSFSLAKHHALHRTGGVSPLSSSEILRSRYSPGQFMTHQQTKPSVPSLEQFQNNPYLKTEVNIDNQFSFQNSPSPQNPFLSERRSFGGIPFISDATADSGSPYSNHGISATPATKQEEDSLDYFYNRHSPSDENCEPTPSHSFEKGNSTVDYSVFSQKSDDSFLSEGNRGDPNVNEDSQSQSSLTVNDSPGDISSSTRKLSTRLFREDSHHGSGDSDENPFKRQKLSHDLDNESVDLQGSELEKSTRESSTVAGDSVENSSKCQKPDNETGSDSVSVEKSELEKHIAEVSEPVVGLDYLKEFKKENVPPSLYTYKCSLCNCSSLAKHVLMHILSVKHRLRYLKSMDESEHRRIMKLRASQNELSSIVAGAIADLEKKHGRGSVKVVCVPSSEAKNSEENLEDSFNISLTVSTSSMLPQTDDLLLNAIPEPPDLKLLNDILSTAQTLQSGASKEFFQLAGTEKNEELQKQESPEFKAETTGSKWQLGCEIPPPPPLPFTEGASSPWNQDTSRVKTSPAATATTPQEADAVTSHLLPPPTLCSNKTDAPQKYPSSECGPGIFPMELPKSPVKNENSEIRDSSTSESSDHITSHHAVSGAAFSSGDCLKFKSDTGLESELEALPKIPLINDTADDVIENRKTYRCVNIPSPFKDMPAEGAVLTEEEEELGKAAIFEHLSLCTVTNEAEADLVQRMILTLSEMYFVYKLRDLPKLESESLLQAVHLGKKEGIEKLTSILYPHSTTDDSFSENDGDLNSCEERNTSHKNDGISSPLQSVKAEESELAKSFKSDSGSVPPPTQEDEGSESFLNSVSPHMGHEFNKSIGSPSSLALCEAELINGTKDVANPEGSPIKEAVNEKCSEGNTTLKDEENPQNLAKLTFVPLPPPPPPLPEESASQTAVSEQSAYPQTSASYGGWPMTYYTAATQAGGYMYWPSQNMGGVDPSVMNTQYMIPTQNSDTSLYSWCQQAPPPLPPPPPPPPPPPASSAP